MDISQDLITSAVAQLGIGVIFLYLFMGERKDRKEETQKRDVMFEKLLVAFNQNTKSFEDMKGSLDKNTSVIEQISRK